MQTETPTTAQVTTWVRHLSRRDGFNPYNTADTWTEQARPYYGDVIRNERDANRALQAPKGWDSVRS